MRDPIRVLGQIVAVPLTLLGMARAWPHIPRLALALTWALVIVTAADVAWDALQLMLLLA